MRCWLLQEEMQSRPAPDGQVAINPQRDAAGVQDLISQTSPALVEMVQAMSAAGIAGQCVHVLQLV